MPKGQFIRTKKWLRNFPRGKNHANYGKRPSKETRKKMSLARQGYRMPPQIIQKIAATRKKRLHTYRTKPKHTIKVKCKNCNKTIEFFPSYKRKFCSQLCFVIWNKHNPRFCDTKIELAIEAELARRNIPYIKQAPIEKIAIVDFLLPDRTIVQCDGDYWHSLGNVKKRDANQDFKLGFGGYTVFRFTETEIHKSASKCIQKVIESRRGKS